MDDQFSKFLNMFRKLEINIHFSEALAQMPHYAKFMKEIINKKRKVEECGIVNIKLHFCLNLSGIWNYF